MLLYLFVWLVVRSATRGLSEGAPQESIIIPAAEAAALRASLAPPSRHVVVLASPTLQPGTSIDLTSTAGVGRGPENAIRLDGDTTVSGRHATLDTPRGRAVGRGRRLDERDVRERRARHVGATPRAGRRHPDRPHRPPRRGIDRATRTRSGPDATPGAGAARTRTRSSASRRSSPWRTEWEARRPASSPRAWPRRRSRRARSPSGARRASPGIVRTANARIFEHSVRDPNAAGMGTTATIAFVDEEAETATIAHVGDSRAYRYRDGVARAAHDGPLARRRARPERPADRGGGGRPSAPLRHHARARHRGRRGGRHAARSTCAPATSSCICSDGLSAMVRDEEIVRLLEQTSADPHAAAEALVAAANRAGGEDNVTVVLFELVEGEPVVRPAPPASRRSRRRRPSRSYRRPRRPTTTSRVTVPAREAGGRRSCCSSR